MIRALLIAFLFVLTLTTQAYGQDECEWSWCNPPAVSRPLIPAPTERFKIRNKDRSMVGDIYNPGHDRRLQIRDNDRNIIGYIETNGTVTDTDRKVVGGIADLGNKPKE